MSQWKLKTETPNELTPISFITLHWTTWRRRLFRAPSTPTSEKQCGSLPQPVSYRKRLRPPKVVECWALMRLLGRKRPSNWLFLLHKCFPPRIAVSSLTSLLHMIQALMMPGSRECLYSGSSTFNGNSQWVKRERR